MDLTGVGIWSSQLRYGSPAESADAAAELDELGFRALWIPDVGGAVFDAVGNLLAATMDDCLDQRAKQIHAFKQVG